MCGGYYSFITAILISLAVLVVASAVVVVVSVSVWCYQRKTVQ